MTPIDINGAIIQQSNSAISISANSITGFDINSSNFPVNSRRPGFIVMNSNGYTTWGNSWQNVAFNYEIYDNNNCFNTSTSAFTAPVSGTYYFEAHAYTTKSPSTNDTSYSHPLFRINDSYTYRQASYTTPYRLRTRTYSTGSYSSDTMISDVFYLAAGDYVHFHQYHGDGTIGVYQYHSLFSGFLIG